MQSRSLRIRFEDHAKTTPEFTAWLQKLLAPVLDKRWESAGEALAALEEVDV